MAGTFGASVGFRDVGPLFATLPVLGLPILSHPTLPTLQFHPLEGNCGSVLHLEVDLEVRLCAMLNNPEAEQDLYSSGLDLIVTNSQTSAMQWSFN